jgi:SAM-dependent methyltransferase
VSTTERDHAASAYDAFADHYDHFTAHHRYDLWCATIEQLALAAGLQGKRLLDAGCGTGKSFLPFLERGYDVTACDASWEMLAQARAKAGGRARLLHRDIRALDALGQFDLVCCLDDVINYLHTGVELHAAFAGLRRNLAPDGVLVFDANTLLAYRTFFASTSVVPAADRVVVWRGGATADFSPGDVAEATVEALERGPDDAWTSTSHQHLQRHHPEDLIRSTLTAVGFGAVHVEGMRTDGALFPELCETEHTKALYVATR